MHGPGLRTGHLVALSGAIATLVSLWLPWYTLTFPPAFRQMLTDQMGQDPGLLGRLARGMASALPERISASGWHELQGADVAMAVVAGIAIAVVLVAAGALAGAVRLEAAAGARTIAAAGTAGLLIAGEHLLVHPGGAMAEQLVHVAAGIPVALAGCAAMIVGGLLAARPRAEKPSPAALWSAPVAPAAAAPVDSVPPPGMH